MKQKLNERNEKVKKSKLNKTALEMIYQFHK